MACNNSRIARHPQLLRDLVTLARGEKSARSFAELAGVSHTAITRIESGDVGKPRRDVLAKISHGESQHLALLYAAGHITPGEFVEELKPLFAEEGAMTKVLEALGESVPDGQELVIDPRDARRQLAQGGLSESDLDRYARFLGGMREYRGGSGPLEWLRFAEESQSEQLRELLNVWIMIGEQARGDLLRYARKLREIQDLRLRAEREAQSLSRGEW